MKKFVCPVCGYVHEAEEMAADFKCPLCRVPGSKFKVMEEGKLAAVHELREIFVGDCVLYLVTGYDFFTSHSFASGRNNRT